MTGCLGTGWGCCPAHPACSRAALLPWHPGHWVSQASGQQEALGHPCSCWGNETASLRPTPRIVPKTALMLSHLEAPQSPRYSIGRGLSLPCPQGCRWGPGVPLARSLLKPRSGYVSTPSCTSWLATASPTAACSGPSGQVGVGGHKAPASSRWVGPGAPRSQGHSPASSRACPPGSCCLSLPFSGSLPTASAHQPPTCVPLGTVQLPPWPRE